MGDFERPKPKALTDTELTSALLGLKSETDSLLKSEELLSQQTVLRQQDEEDLRTWQNEISQTLGLDIVTPEQAIASGPLMAEQSNQEAVFTSQLSIVQPKTRFARRVRAISYWAQFASNLFLAGLLSGVTLIWLGISSTDAVIAAVAGSTLSVFPSLVLKVHVHHPFVRGATVFGAKSSFVAAVALLFLFSWLMVGVLSDTAADSSAGFSGALANWEQGIFLAGIGVIALLGITLRPRALRFSMPIAGIAGLTIVASTFQLPFSPGDFLSPGSGWPVGTFAVFLISSLIQVYVQPHEKPTSRSLWVGLPMVIVLISGVALSVALGGTSLRSVLVATAFLFFLSLVVIVRDVGTSISSRIASLLVLIPIASILLPVDYLAAPLVGLIYLLSVSTMDQIARSSALHIPSLGVGYGFYGGFQISTWIGLAVAITSGILLDAGVFEPYLTSVDFESAALLGAGTGLLFGILRIPLVRRQDREIKLVQIHNTGAKDLLGL